MNIYSKLGLIPVVGIAKKNSIMLVDFTNQIRALPRLVEVHDMSSSVLYCWHTKNNLGGPS
ncbi:MAG: efflux RND transporter permease subunit [Acidobacteria bacterium]|nr:efflux RND transporter permease subunit [Acidobacteriota bacterium]